MVALEAPRRVQLSRARGWRMPPNTTHCARPGRWGNPFTVQTTRAFAVMAFSWLIEEHDGGGIYPNRATIRAELHGRHLACWCPLGEPCHCDVLLVVANRTEDPS